MKRRSPGNGSIRKRDSGGWQARITVQGRQLSSTFKTKTEANAWVRQELSRADEGMLLTEARKITLAEYLEHWLKIIEPNVRIKTFQERSWARSHIVPALGAVLLRDLRPDHLQRLYVKKLDEGLSPRSVQIIHAVLRKSLKDAVKWNLLGRNVTAAVTPPKSEKREMKVWTPEETRIFLEGVQGTRPEALYRLALSCGPRLGELLGLRWEDVDLGGKKLRIRRTLQRIRGYGLVVGNTKTKGSCRQIHLPGPVVEALRKNKLRQVEERLRAGPAWKDEGWVFPNSVGAGLEPNTLIRNFQKHTERLGLPRIRIHDLRHTAATLLLARGVHPKIVQELLGHSQISITLNTYSHVLPSMHEQAARVMEELLP